MECFKWGLMGYPRRNIEEFAAVNGLNCAGGAQEVSVEKNLSVSETVSVVFWRRMWLLFAIVQTVCPDTKVKKFSLIALKQEVLKQPGVNSVV